MGALQPAQGQADGLSLKECVNEEGREDRHCGVWDQQDSLGSDETFQCQEGSGEDGRVVGDWVMAGEAFGSLLCWLGSGRETHQSCARGQSSRACRWGVLGQSSGSERPDGWRGGVAGKDGLTR